MDLYRDGSQQRWMNSDGCQHRLIDAPKYTRMEYERRFLVDPASDWQQNIKPYSKLFDDRYLSCGRLRLRRIQNSDSNGVAWKLTKKYEPDSPFAQPVVSVWLSEAEYEALKSLDGHNISKRRHYHERDGLVFSIDVFQGELDGLILCETESDSVDSLHAIRFPEYARCEVTRDPFFNGGSLCRAEQPQLAAAIAHAKATSA